MLPYRRSSGSAVVVAAAKKKERRPDRSSYLISVMAILHGRNKANWIPTFTAVSM